MVPQGILPASVTPMTPSGDVDFLSLAKLGAYFHAAGCAGMVIAGTNGEGPSLSAVEKRDLAREAVRLCDPLPIVLGISSPSLHEAEWLVSQAHKCGCAAALVMAPGYFRNASENGIRDWFLRLADRSPCPLILYNFPKFTGFTMSPEFVHLLARHPQVVGFKDSSGAKENLLSYREAAEGKRLFVGDETLLLEALEAGWDGSISGAANLIPQWLSEIMRAYESGDKQSAHTKFQVVLPLIEQIRSQPQPATNKAVLSKWGIIASPIPRLPLEEVSGVETAELLRTQLGLK